MRDRTVVVGGGWAGLSAAVSLAAAGEPVLLLEAAPQLGGRARGLDFGPDRVDNGQHLLIGAYRQTLALLGQLGLSEAQVFERRPLRLDLYRSRQDRVRLALPPALPAPANLLWALLRARGFRLGERLAGLRFALAMGLRRFRLTHDRTVADLLRAQRQPAALVEALWSPLCLATLNTPIEEASAQLFLHVLRDSFTRRAGDAQLLLPRCDLGRLLPQPAAEFLARHGGEIRTGRRVTALETDAGRIVAVLCGSERIAARRVILATPAAIGAELLRPLPTVSTTVERMDRLGSYPICTIYLRYPCAVSLPEPLIGLLNGPGQWAFTRRADGHADVLSVVISGPGAHMQTDRASLAAQVAAQLAGLFAELPEPVDSLVVRDKRATFSAGVGVQECRPGSETSVRGLWLAGDYVHGPYPATLEGAVRSGVQCARRILRGVERHAQT